MFTSEASNVAADPEVSMKSRSARAAAVVLSLAILAGCGTSGGEDAADTTEAKTTTTVDTRTTEPADDTTTTEAESDLEGDDVEVWAVSFCESFDGEWMTAIEDASSTMDVTPGDIEGAKAAIVDLFDTAGSVTEDLIVDLEDLGAPEADNGEEIHAEMLSRFGDFRDLSYAAAEEMAAVPSDDPTAFQTATMDILDGWETDLGDVAASFAEIDAEYPSPELGLAVSANCSF